MARDTMLESILVNLLLLTLISYVWVIYCDAFWNKGNNLYQYLHHESFYLLTWKIVIYSYKPPSNSGYRIYLRGGERRRL